MVLLGHAICWERNKSKKVFLLTILDQKKTIRTKIERCLCRVRWHLHFCVWVWVDDKYSVSLKIESKVTWHQVDSRVSVWGRLSSLKIDKKCFLLFYLFYLFYFFDFCVTFRLFGHFCYFLFRQCTIIRGMRRIQLLIGWISSALSIYLVAGNKLMSSY